MEGVRRHGRSHSASVGVDGLWCGSPGAPIPPPPGAELLRVGSEVLEFVPQAMCVMVVDGSDTCRRVCVKQLQRVGFRLCEASSGEEALLKLHECKVDLLLVEVHLPGMTGEELLSVLKEASHDVCVIMVSASEDPMLQKRCFVLGADDFLFKPLRQELLSRRIRLVLTDRTQKNKAKMYHKMLREEKRRGERLSREMQEKDLVIEQLAKKAPEAAAGAEIAGANMVDQAIATPIQQLRDILVEVLKGNHSEEEASLLLENAMRNLGSNLYRPAFAWKQGEEVSMDMSIRQYLMNQFSRTPHTSSPSSSSTGSSSFRRRTRRASEACLPHMSASRTNSFRMRQNRSTSTASQPPDLPLGGGLTSFRSQIILPTENPHSQSSAMGGTDLHGDSGSEGVDEDVVPSGRGGSATAHPILIPRFTSSFLAKTSPASLEGQPSSGGGRFGIDLGGLIHMSPSTDYLLEQEAELVAREMAKHSNITPRRHDSPLLPPPLGGSTSSADHDQDVIPGTIGHMELHPLPPQDCQHPKQQLPLVEKDESSSSFSTFGSMTPTVTGTPPVHPGMGLSWAALNLRTMESSDMLMAETNEDEDWCSLEFVIFDQTPAENIRMLEFFFEELRLFEEFPIDRVKFVAFLEAVRCHYRDNFYHNFWHICDVTHWMFLILSMEDIQCCLSPLDILTLMVSTIVHDLDHNGRNNNFHVNTYSDLAVMYNDQSVLENHHCCLAFQLFLQKELHFLEGLPKDEWAEFRRGVITTVLATDMANHFEHVSKFQARITTGVPLSCESPDDRTMLMQMLMKAADICNQGKSFSIAREWTRRYTMEIFMQGDEEKRLGLPVSPMMDREDTNVFKMQFNFIDFLLCPLYETLSSAFSGNDILQVCMQNVRHNRRCWAELAEKWHQEGDSKHMAAAQLEYVRTIDPSNLLLTTPRRGSVGSSLGSARSTESSS